jgi:GT2 family glycosyltransferase
VDDIDQPVLGGTIYEWIVIIDSDNYPTAQQILKLISQDKDIIAGWFGMANPDLVLDEDRDALKACVGVWVNRDLYQFRPYRVGELKEKTETFEIDTTGQATLVVRRGVFEMLRYPWFEPVVVYHENKAWFAGIDTAWCKKVQDVGFHIYCDPTVRVPHKKRMLI